MPPFIAVYQSPLGTILLSSDGTALTGLHFLSDTNLPVNPAVPEMPVFAQSRQWLDAYFAGRLPGVTPRLDPQGTSFQCRVWQALLTIPYGQTCTYGDIARLIGCRSARAVGQAVGSNPVALIIPCHRVVGANGRLGGYAYGSDRKKRLLDLEKQYASNT